MEAAAEQKTSPIMRMFNKNEYTLTIILFLLPTMLFLTLFVVWPILSSFNLSFYEWNGIDPVREPVGFENWIRLLNDGVFWKAFGNNLVVVVLSIGIQIPFGLAMAVLLERGSSRWGIFRIYKTVYFFPMLMASVAIGILFKYIYDPTFGLINGLLEGVGLDFLTHAWLSETNIVLYSVIAVICWQFTPFYMILFMAGLTSVPVDLRDAALIDGATDRQYYQRIAIPLLKGTVRTAVVLSLIGSLKYFDLIWVMTEGGPNHASELMATYMYKKAFPSFEMGYGSTVASAMFIIVMVISLVTFTLTGRFETEV